jgi:hypothetical protein
MNGAGGNDNLLGASGNDTLNGGPQTDSCNGGAGTADKAIACERVTSVP